MSYETQFLVSLQSCEDAQSGSNERIITIKGVSGNAFLIQLPILIDIVLIDRFRVRTN